MAGVIEVVQRIEAGGEGGAWPVVMLPRKVTAALGTRALVRVKVRVNGSRAFRTSLSPTGKGTHMLMVNRQMRAAAKVAVGDRVPIAIEADAQRRVVRQPPELKAALAGNAKAQAHYDRLPPSHKRAYVTFIAEARKPETRARRVAQTVAMLAEGKRRA